MRRKIIENHDLHYFCYNSTTVEPVHRWTPSGPLLAPLMTGHPLKQVPSEIIFKGSYQYWPVLKDLEKNK